MVTDPIADFLTRLRNAGAVKKEAVSLPYSRLKHAIADKLLARGYVRAVEKHGRKAKKTLEVTLAVKKDGSPRITGAARVSRPGRRSYLKASEIMPVRFGKGAILLSTPKGIMTGAEARKEKVGGEALFKIW